jgi:hypothetical protein
MLTAMLLWAAYAGGIWFFSSVVWGRRWRSVRVGFPAVVLFSTLMAIATLLHWSRFHFGHVSFVTWALLYLTTPALTLAALACGLALFVMPVELGRLWAWEVTPLTARVVGAVLTLPGMVNAGLLIGARWSEFRGVLIAEIVSLVGIVIAIALRLGDFEWPRPAAGGFVGGILVSLVVYLAFFVSCERSIPAADRGRRRS